MEEGRTEEDWERKGENRRGEREEWMEGWEGKRRERRGIGERRKVDD